MTQRTFGCALAAALLFLCPFGAFAQQTLKGLIQDNIVKTPLPGATVQLQPAGQPAAPWQGSASDINGRFRFEGLKPGKYALLVRYLGYKDAVLGNVVLNAGKETELLIELEEAVLQGREAVVTAKIDKQKPLNEFSTVSSRTFSVEETQRFAAAVNDPGRMASSFAGVSAPLDGSNQIVIRGNAPNGLLWRMEGVDIPNPNHFSNVGSAGGGISILSAQLLSNSDFSTGAFAAEYGDALSGVFDLKLRKGNAEKREYTFSAGVLGLDAAVEGPLRLGANQGSFLVNYRYSTLSLLGRLGVNLEDGRTDFQDLSFNLWLPTRRMGAFTLFGFGGLSSQNSDGKADSLRWRENAGLRYPYQFSANTGAIGLTHSLTIGDNSFLKTVLSQSLTENALEEFEIQLPDYRRQREFRNNFQQQRQTLSSVLSHKFNAQHYLKAGVYGRIWHFDLDQLERDPELGREVTQIAFQGQTSTLNAFAQWQFRPTEKLTLNTGLHAMTLLLNQSWSLEPRAALKYAVSPKQSLSLGYGLHSQMQPIGVYFVQDAAGQRLNGDLGLSKAQHLVLGFDQSLGQNRRLKAELYHQGLFDVPVARGEASDFSMLNQFDGFVTKPLENSGRGRNYGLEITLEQFLTRGFYGLWSNSLYRSEYQGSDGIWRDSRFDSRFNSTLTAGKEWDWTRRGKDRTFGLNLKAIAAGGLRDTPIDLEASRLKGETVHVPGQIFSLQMPTYFRLDVGVRLKRNYNRRTGTFSLDLQNATNRRNIFGRFFEKETGEIKTIYLAPLIPVLAYKLEF